jgi:peroxiredoxin
MLEPGETAPTFSLPGVVDGEIETVELDGAADEVIVLAFYPMDFTPACTEEVCAIREAELFSIADHVRLYGISADSAFAHRVFAAEHDLPFPLLSDRLGDVAEAYGVLHDELDGHERVPQRAVFVVDTHQTIQYAWATTDPMELPDLDEVVHAVKSIRDDSVASEMYADAHTQYTYGIAEFDRARELYDEERWAVAEETFSEADWYLSAAEAGFSRARRFATPGPVREAAAAATDRARGYKQGASWFEAAAEQQIAGAVAAATEYVEDATRALETASQQTVVEPEALEPGDEPDA